ncbi:hypothetical protein V8C34DRAFT_322808, partial [Trichoderma compactum]
RFKPTTTFNAWRRQIVTSTGILALLIKNRFSCQLNDNTMGQSASSFGFGSGSSGGFGFGYGEGFRSGYSGGFRSDNALFERDDNSAFNFGEAGAGPNFFSGSSFYRPREFDLDTNRFSFLTDARDSIRQEKFTDVDVLLLNMETKSTSRRSYAPGVDLNNRCPGSVFSSGPSGLGGTENFSDYPALRVQERSLHDVAKNAEYQKSSVMPRYSEVLRSPQLIRFEFGLEDKTWTFDRDKNTGTFSANAFLQGSKPGASFRLDQPFDLHLFNDVRLGNIQLRASNDRQSAGIRLNPYTGGRDGSVFISDAFLTSKINKWLPTDALKNVKLDTGISWAHTPPIFSKCPIPGFVGYGTLQALDLAITAQIGKKWTNESATSIRVTHNRSKKWGEWDTRDSEVSDNAEKSETTLYFTHKQPMTEYLDFEAGVAKTIAGTSSDGTRWSINIKPRSNKVY